MNTFISEIRNLARFCNFGDSLDAMIRDRLVCGINDDQIQKRLLSEGDQLTLTKAVTLAQAMETATKDSQLLQPQGVSVQMVKDKRETRNILCYRCARPGHSPANCRFQSAKCHKCQKIGHIMRACTAQRPTKAVRQVTHEEAPQDDDDFGIQNAEYSLFNLNSTSNQPFQVVVIVDNQQVPMEIDTGAAVSLVSEETYKKLWPHKPLQQATIVLKTYSGEQLQLCGSMEVDVVYGTQHCTLPLLVIKGNGPSLLGRDWLKHFELDWKAIYTPQRETLEVVLAQHKDVFQESLGTLNGYSAKIHVDASAKPKFFKARTIPYAYKLKVEEELDRLVKLGIIEPVQFAEWAAPIVAVLKSDKKSIRICGDFKLTVNSVSKVDRYPIPKIDDLVATLSGGQKFTKLDMSQAYMQIMLSEDSKQYVIINTHRGLFRYNRLPFGIASAPGIFQRVMESILKDIPGVVVYLDDILITGHTDADHLRSLQETLSRLERAGLRLRKEKCSFMGSSVTYLGYRIDKEGLHPLADKVKALKQAPQPRNITELRSFLGLLTYYGKFLPHLPSVLAPLYELLRRNVPWNWESRQEVAFNKAKELLTSSKVLVHFDPKLDLILACDASSYGVGAVLAHRMTDGSEKPIAFVSRTLTESEQRYAQIEREGLACVFGVTKFHAYLYGRHFTLITDHKPLASLFSEHRAVPTQASARI